MDSALCTHARRLASVAGILAAMAPVACGVTDAETEPLAEPDPVFDYPLDDVLRFQHLQAKSTHNSYHVETEGNTLVEWHYTHAPLDQQLDVQGVRHVELDVRWNAASARFLVYHLPIVDEQTTCRELTTCLALLKAWSDAHRAHHPIVVQIEIKDALAADPEGYFGALHAELTSVWPPSRIVTPDFVRGDHATLAAALADGGWPTLGELRGKVLFTLNDSGVIRDAYVDGHPNLEGRLVFPESLPGDSFAAIAIINDPVAGADSISAALPANLLVRTRADGDGPGDPAVRDAALASGAQFVTTDFPAPVAGTDYWLDIPGGTPSRCNPVTAPAACTSKALEDPAFVHPP